MKIMQIYCNDDRFKTIKFEERLNLIVGRVIHEKDLEKDSHNLGKTTLIDLIDFLLLKEIDKTHFLMKKDFKDHVFFMELKLNSGGYVTIRRSVTKNTKIALKLHSEQHQNYLENNDWDYENLALTSKFDNENPKKILDSLLGFDVLSHYNYRQTVNYFLRTQYDYLDVFRLSKFKGSDGDWKPFLFELLGFDKTNIVDKYDLDEAKRNQEKKIKEIQQQFAINPEELDKINGLIEIKEEEKLKIQEKVDKFDFYLKERGLNRHLVEGLEQEISQLNTAEYNLSYEISKIKESLETNNTFDLEETLEIFEEVQIYFSEQLKKNYEDLVAFNVKITNERKKHLSEVLTEKVATLEAVEQKLNELNTQRMEVMKYLREKDSFQKFKNYQLELIQVEKEIERLRIQLENIDVVKNEKSLLESINNDIKKVTEKIQTQVDVSNNLYKSIRKDYYNYLKTIISRPGVLSIKTNSNGNVEFKAEISNENNELTAEDKGYSYRKIMCACFDIALLTNYHEKSFFRFIYHDGCLESLDPRKRIKYLKLIENICNQYDIQYILTLLEPSLPTMADGEKYRFTNANVAAEFSDEDDDTGRMFGFTY